MLMAFRKMKNKVGLGWSEVEPCGSGGGGGGGWN